MTGKLFDFDQNQIMTGGRGFTLVLLKNLKTLILNY